MSLNKNSPPGSHVGTSKIVSFKSYVVEFDRSPFFSFPGFLMPSFLLALGQVSQHLVLGRVHTVSQVHVLHVVSYGCGDMRRSHGVHRLALISPDAIMDRSIEQAQMLNMRKKIDIIEINTRK